MKTLKDGIRRRRTFMDGLGAQLKSLKRASLPLQTHLELPFALAERRTRAARALPPPLYVLYTQLAAAKEAFAEDIDVSIEGSIADAEAFARREAAAREKKEKVSERGDGGVSGGVVSGSKLEDGDDEDGERTRKRARTSTGAGEDGDDPYATHPLAVVLVVGSGSATCTFRHHVALRVVSCETRASLDADLLVNLFPDDDGEESPNAANALRWRGFRWDADGRRRERPFRWCQHLAGVDFLPAAPRAGLAEAVHEGVATHQRQARVRHVLAAIRARITSRAKLKCESRLFRECILEPNPGERECILSRTRTRTNPKPGKSNPHRTPHPTTPLTGASSARSRGATWTRSPPRVVSRCDPSARSHRGERRRTFAKETTNPRRRVRRVPGTGTGPGSDTATRTVSVTARRFRATFRASNRRGAGGGDGVDIVADVVVPAEFPRKPPTFALALERGAAPRPPPPSDVDADVDAGVHAGERPANDRRTTGEEEDRSATTFASNDLRLMEEETNARCLSLVPPGDADETLGYQVVRLMQAVDAATERERWGGADDEAAGVRQTRRGRERRKELPPLL